KETKKVVDQVSDKIDEYEDIIDVSYVTVGGDGDFTGGTSGGNEASFTIQLVDPSDREMTTAEFVQQLNDDTTSIAGAEITISEMEACIGMGDHVQINLTGNEHEVLRDLGDDIVRAIEDIDGVYNHESGATLGVPQLKLEIDKEKAVHYGLSTD